LDDPANADFLTALASGRTPQELLQTDGTAAGAAGGPDGSVVVGLIDKRSVDYEEEEETFQSFSGQGTSLGSGTATDAAADGMFDPTTLPESPPTVDESQPTTSIAVRTLSSGRRVIRINLSSTVRDLAAHVRPDAVAGGDAPSSFYLAAGFPPKTLTDPNQTIEEAGLKGAQVSMKK
jgi:UBX domain-containing protein 1